MKVRYRPESGGLCGSGVVVSAEAIVTRRALVVEPSNPL